MIFAVIRVEDSSFCKNKFSRAAHVVCPIVQTQEWSLLLQGHEEEDRSLGERLNRLLARDTRNNLIWDGKLQN